MSNKEMTFEEELKYRLNYIYELMTEQFYELKDGYYEINPKYREIKDVIQEATLVSAMCEINYD